MSLDRGLTWVTADEVRVIEVIDRGDDRVEVHQVFNHEGAVIDVVQDDEIVGTNSITWGEIVESMTAP